MDRDFKDKTVLVTGASRGLGLAIAQRFLSSGANVVFLDNHAQRLTQVTDAMRPSRRVLAFAMDVTRQDQVDVAVAKTIEQWGQIDILANVAGIAQEHTFLDCPLNSWQKIIDVNLTGMFIVGQAVAKQMVKHGNGGVIINMGSKNGLVAEVGYTAYNTSKGGIVMLSKTMAAELAVHNIRVHCVCPGYIRTPLADELDSEAFQQRYAQRLIPLNRLGKPQEVAGLFAFLASEDAAFMTGETITVDGGHTCFDGRKEGDANLFMKES